MRTTTQTASGRTTKEPATTPGPALVALSRDLWSMVPAVAAPGPENVPTLPRVGPEVPTSRLVSWVNDRSWDVVAAHWPSLDPSQRITAIYAISGVPLPPGIGSRRQRPSDWLVAMALVSQRHALLAGADLDVRQWTTAWASPLTLLPTGVRTTPAADWLDHASTDKASRHILRRAALESHVVASLPFSLVWELARPLTQDTVGAVVAHPRASVEALVETAQFTPLPPEAVARLAANPLFPAERVPLLYADAEPGAAERLVRTSLTTARLLELIEQPLPPRLVRGLVANHSGACDVALAMKASTRALTALFIGLDVADDPVLRDAALRSRRVEARRALAAAAGDPALLAALADDHDEEVRAIAARRVLDALSPTDPTADLEEALSA